MILEFFKTYEDGEEEHGLIVWWSRVSFDLLTIQCYWPTSIYFGRRSELYFQPDCTTICQLLKDALQSRTPHFKLYRSCIIVKSGITLEARIWPCFSFSFSLTVALVLSSCGRFVGEKLLPESVLIVHLHFIHLLEGNWGFLEVKKNEQRWTSQPGWMRHGMEMSLVTAMTKLSWR